MKKLASISARNLFTFLAVYCFYSIPVQAEILEVAELVKTNMSLMFGSLPDSYEKCSEAKLRNGGSFLAGEKNVIIQPGKIAQQIASTQQNIYKNGGRSVIELSDGTILLFGLDAQRYGDNLKCDPDVEEKNCTPTMRYIPAHDRWEPVPELNIPYAWAGLMLKGPNQYDRRNDVVARRNGDFVYLTEIQDEHNEGEEKWLPQDASIAYRWKSGEGVKPLATLQQARAHASLLELNDGRLAVMGGEAQQMQVALEKSCHNCPDTFSTLGSFDKTRTTEIFDDKSQRWLPGPLANYPGGMALKLENGRIFKLYCTGRYYHFAICLAEIADADFTQWHVLPSPPVELFGLNDVVVSGNRVILLGNKTRESKKQSLGGGLSVDVDESDYSTVVWNDDTQKWSVWQQWTNALDTPARILSITPLPGNDRVRIRYPDSYKTVDLPTE